MQVESNESEEESKEKQSDLPKLRATEQLDFDPTKDTIEEIFGLYQDEQDTSPNTEQYLVKLKHR